MFAWATCQKISLVLEGSVPIECFSVASIDLVFSHHLNSTKRQYHSLFSSHVGMTFRHMLYPAYKSNRTPTPDTVVQGMQYLKASIKAMSIKVIEVKIYQYAFYYNLDSYLLFNMLGKTQESSISVKWDSCWYLALSNNWCCRFQVLKLMMLLVPWL